MFRSHVGALSCAIPRIPGPVLLGAAVAWLAVPGAAQTSWSLATPAHRPSPRAHAAAAWDASRSEVVLFGGDGALAPKLADTWVWNGDDWTERFPATVPTARNVAMMAFDPLRSRALLFGGVVAGTYAGITVGDTWEWDGVAWVERFPAHSPGPHAASGMAFDAGRGEIVLFGGTLAGGTVFGDTWTWNGSDWTQRLPAHAPSPRFACAMAYDAGYDRVVLFGGLNQSQTVTHADTWTWDGSDWTQQAPAHVPPARCEHGMVFDSARQRVVMQGGLWQADTWEWNGTDWTQMPDLAHDIRAPSMVFDATRGMTVLFGGEWAGYSNETWLYGPGHAASYVTFGSGCAGWAGTPWLATGGSPPRLGQVFQLQLFNLPPDHSTLVALGWSNTNWLGSPLPLDLAVIGAAGCQLLISPDVLDPVFNWAGYATWTLYIPNQPALAGLAFYNQAAAVDHANALGLVFTQGGAARIGDH